MKYLDSKPFSVAMGGSKQFDKNWDAIFGKKGDTLPSAPESRVVWLCTPCFKRRWPDGREELTIGRLSGTHECHDCGDVMEARDPAHALWSRELS